jgi:hypothetical protein
VTDIITIFSNCHLAYSDTYDELERLKYRSDGDLTWYVEDGILWPGG